MTTIGLCAFKDCTSLESIDIPNTVTEIYNQSFEGCSALRNIDLSNSVKIIAEGSFLGCTSLKTIDLPNSVTDINSNAFNGCVSLKSIDIPDSVTLIGFNAFKNCISIESIDIPNSVTSIGDYAFYGCKSLKKINMQSSLTNIGKFAFWGTSLMAINIPAHINDIGEHAFCNCPISNVTVDKGNVMFFSKNDILYKNDNGVKNSLVKYAPKKASKRFCIDKNTKSLHSCAFKESEELEEIVLHDGISSLGDEQTFAYCISLKNIKLPSSINKIPIHAFGGCSSLQDIVLPNSENYSIEKEVFVYCNSLKSVHSPTKKIENIVIDENAFDGFDIDACTLYIPSGTRWEYRHHPGFKRFKNIEIEKQIE